MWQSAGGGRYTLVRRRAWHKQYLPSLSARDHFRFDASFEAEWTHEWPRTRICRAKKIIFFERDPVDALHSGWRRDPAGNFRAYVEALDDQTLLDRAETHALFAHTWLRKSNVRRFRFEDYKTDPERTLSNILTYVGIDARPSEIAAAVAASTSDKAAEAERVWIASPEAREFWARLQPANQGGIVGRGQEVAGQEPGTVERIRTLRDRLDVSTLSAYYDFLRKHNKMTWMEVPVQEKGDDGLAESLQRRALGIARSIDQGQLRAYMWQPLLIGLGCLALGRDSTALAAVERAYCSRFGTRGDFYLSVYRRSRTLSALVRISPHAILRAAVQRWPASDRRRW
jgi:hypothetical protein